MSVEEDAIIVAAFLKGDIQGYLLANRYERIVSHIDDIIVIEFCREDGPWDMEIHSTINDSLILNELYKISVVLDGMGSGVIDAHLLNFGDISPILTHHIIYCLCIKYDNVLKIGTFKILFWRIMNYKPLEIFVGKTLTEEHKANIKCVKKNGLYLYNYNNKVIVKRDDPILMKCRGLILDSNGAVVCYPLNRFFNLHEPVVCSLDWNSAEIFEKVDGSLINVWYYNNKWNVTTRGAFYPITNAEVDFDWLFRKHFKSFNALNPKYCYSFELCTARNRIVTWYDEPGVVLLSARHTTTLKEVGQKTLDSWTLHMPDVRRPKRFKANDPARARELFEGLKDDEEGFVIVDKNHHRTKIKQDSYFALGKIKSLNDNDILDYIRGRIELDAELVYKDEGVVQKVADTTAKWNTFTHMVEKTFDLLSVNETRKGFAIEALQYPFSGFLFMKLDSRPTRSIKVSYEQLEAFIDFLEESRPCNHRGSVSTILHEDALVRYSGETTDGYLIKKQGHRT